MPLSWLREAPARRVSEDPTRQRYTLSHKSGLLRRARASCTDSQRNRTFMDDTGGFVIEEIHRDDPYQAEQSSAAAAGLAGESTLEFDSAGNASLQGEQAPQTMYKVHTPMESAHSGISGSRYDVLIPKPLRGSAAALGSTVQHYKVGASSERLGDTDRGHGRSKVSEEAADALQAVIGPAAASAGGPVPSAPGGAIIELQGSRGRATDGSDGS